MRQDAGTSFALRREAHLAGVRKAPVQFAGFGGCGGAQLNVSPTRRISHASIVLGFTSPLKSGKNRRISAAVRIGAPVTETGAPNASAPFADSTMPLRVRAA